MNPKYDKPSVIEAIKPQRECSCSERLRFMNYTSKLNVWSKQFFLKRTLDQRFKPLLYWQLAHELIDGLTFLEDYPHGTPKWDTAFLSLLPNPIPVGAGKAFTLQQLVAIWKTILADSRCTSTTQTHR